MQDNIGTLTNPPNTIAHAMVFVPGLKLKRHEDMVDFQHAL